LDVKSVLWQFIYSLTVCGLNSAHGISTDN